MRANRRCWATRHAAEALRYTLACRVRPLPPCSEEEFLRYSVVLGRLPDHDFVLLVRLLEESHAHALKSGLIAALHMTPVLAAAPAAAGAAAGAP